MWPFDEASTTISQIQALRGARDAGFAVDVEVIHRATDYIARCYHQETGGFVYSIGVTPPHISSYDDGRPTFAISAASMAVLHSIGKYEGLSKERSLSYLESFHPAGRSKPPFFYFGHYYAAQVMHFVGGKKGKSWLQAITGVLTSSQRPGGYWPPDPTDTLDRNDSQILSTAWALQIVLIHQGVLPLHER